MKSLKYLLLICVLGCSSVQAEETKENNSLLPKHEMNLDEPVVKGYVEKPCSNSGNLLGGLFNKALGDDCEL